MCMGKRACTDKRTCVCTLQLNEEEIEEKYGKDTLEPEMTDEMYKLVRAPILIQNGFTFSTN